ncbi:MAG: CBS domain-containing protein [Acidobacteria bacterium]|nr:CBS domain-containing protein [Acidobacteriota bacterium]
MDTVGTLLREKGSSVLTTPAEATVLQAVEAMCAHKIGAVLVERDGAPAGIFSERDVMSRVILTRKDPSTTKVADVMTRELVCIEPGTAAAEAMAIMTQRRCRHLPVVNEGKVVGMISIGDLVRWASRNQEFEIRMLTDYISGKYPA